jgi:hypothetical protein
MEWLMSAAETILAWSNAVYAVAVLGASATLAVMWVAGKVKR